jgi:hypothetical protein
MLMVTINTNGNPRGLLPAVCRINLRYLAEVQVLGWIILLFSSWFWMSKFFSFLFSAPPVDNGSELSIPYARNRQGTM